MDNGHQSKLYFLTPKHHSKYQASPYWTILGFSVVVHCSKSSEKNTDVPHTAHTYTHTPLTQHTHTHKRVQADFQDSRSWWHGSIIPHSESTGRKIKISKLA